MKLFQAFLLALVLLMPAAAKVSSRSSHQTNPRIATPRTPKASRAKTRTVRSSSARAAFRKKHPCPATGKSTGACPGYVIDHIRPLKRGGPDTPANMQWQTLQAARAKDRVE
ncbi:MAG: HNH endonuclease signature motif containing protein [Bryobacteraceae bacterium]|nr:HNH endonuclease signature motif containing protein [Bryobacteraceae bacterium]